MTSNRIRAAVLGQFAAYWLVVMGIFLADRSLFDQILAQQVKATGDRTPFEVSTLFVLTALLSLLSVGVVRNWRWTFWLILIAFLFGMLRIPQVALELIGRLPKPFPTWYTLLIAVVGTIQFVTGLAMLTYWLRRRRRQQALARPPA